MNLLLIRRAVLCAALIALSVAGAGWFSTQPVAGQETTLHGAAALEQLKQTGQYESLQAAMNQARFNVSRVGDSPLGHWAWHAPNAAGGYDAYVTETGVSIALNDESYVSLSLHSLGYGAALHGVATGEVSGDKQSITINRNGGLREWFVNGADGLERGFTLDEPPSGARQQGLPLRLALQVSEGWRAIASEDSQRVTLRGADDQAVEYGKLAVRDKLGRTLPARLTVADEQVVIEVEDHEAGYPLTIDPLFTLQQRLLAVDGAANDRLGWAVALDGDTALVGAPYDDAPGADQGSAYVFVRNGTVWTLQKQLTANDGEELDQFGVAVALEGDTALIGALFDNVRNRPDRGSAYVFTRGGATWTQQKQLTDMAGVRVRIRDSQGVERLAPLFFVSPGQINFQVPRLTASGTATISVSQSNGNSGATGQLEITRTAPGLFSANANGQGVPAALALRVRANGTQSFEQIARFDGTRFVPVPIDLGPIGEQVYLVLFGTGFRFQQQVSVRYGTELGNVLFAGAVTGLVGLDQANVLVPRSAIGAGELFLTFNVDGVNANPVQISVR